MPVCVSFVNYSFSDYTPLHSQYTLAVQQILPFNSRVDPVLEKVFKKCIQPGQYPHGGYLPFTSTLVNHILVNIRYYEFNETIFRAMYIEIGCYFV